MLSADPAGARRFAALRARLSPLTPAQAAPALRELASRVRRDDLQMVYRARLGHLGGDFSVTDILVTLYGAVLDVDPAHPLLAERDRLVLSKGHYGGSAVRHPGALRLLRPGRAGYLRRAAVRAQRPPEPDQGARGGDQHGPAGTRVPGGRRDGAVRAAAGLAPAYLRGARRRRAAGRQQLGGRHDGFALRPVLADSPSSTATAPAGRPHRGDQATRAAGRQVGQLRLGGPRSRRPRSCAAAGHVPAGPATARPVAVIAHTVKGKGVSFMEDRVEWHHKVPTAEQVQGALQELSA